MKRSNNRELQQVIFNRSSDIEFDELMKIYIKILLKNHILF